MTVPVRLVLTLFLLSGCDQREPLKKVSLQPQSSTLMVAEDASAPAEPVLSFGFDLRLGPKDDVRIYAPFLKYLEDKTGRRFTIRFTKGYEDTAENLGRGVIQFAALGPVNCARARENHGVGCLAMGLNEQDLAEYRSVIFTRPDSPLASLGDLRGKSFAFGDRLSTQGHILPRRMLEEAGISLENLKEHVFTGSHVETARLVINGRYEAGGLQDTLARRLEAEGKIRILAVSDPSPSSLFCYNKDVDPATLAAVKAALLALDPAGKDAARLVDWNRTEMPHGFVELNEQALARIREMARAYGLLTP